MKTGTDTSKFGCRWRNRNHKLRVLEIGARGKNLVFKRFFPRIYAVKILFNYKMFRYAVDFWDLDFAFDEWSEDVEKFVGDVVGALVDVFAVNLVFFICDGFNRNGVDWVTT